MIALGLAEQVVDFADVTQHRCQGLLVTENMASDVFERFGSVAELDLDVEKFHHKASILLIDQVGENCSHLQWSFVSGTELVVFC